MAVSKDGWMARWLDDDMSWLGATDKAVFRILTGVNGAIGAGRRTAETMPRRLPGRNLTVLSSMGKHTTLNQFYDRHPDGWLIGGPRLALLALDLGLVDEVHLCRSDRMAFPVFEDAPITDLLTPWLEARKYDVTIDEGWRRELETSILDVTVECWRRHGRGS